MHYAPMPELWPKEGSALMGFGQVTCSNSEQGLSPGLLVNEEITCKLKMEVPVQLPKEGYLEAGSQIFTSE